MSNPTQFEVLEESEELSLDEIGKHNMMTLMACGIVNPFGPTLSALVLEGQFQPGGFLSILELTLSPLSQSVRGVGIVQMGDQDTWNILKTIPWFFYVSLKGCPTMLLPSSLLGHEESVALYASFLEYFDDGYSTLEKVRRFPGDPWNRIQNDVTNLESIVRHNGADQSQEMAHRRLTKEEAKELSTSLLEPDNMRHEIQAFMLAWNDSLDFQGKELMGKKAMSLEQFVDYFAMLALSCNI